MKALIFGCNGQDGYYLSDLLKKNLIDVIGISRSGGAITGDVSDYTFVETTIKQYLPDYIFHFAANSTTRHSALFENHGAICTGTLNILESVRLHCETAKVYLSGSAMQFKNTGLPIDETTEFDARSPYSVARIHSTYAGRYYRKTFGLKVYCGYFFNHDSPLRSEAHVNQKIVKAVHRIAQGKENSLELGNLDVKKEFNFAGDIVEAVWQLVNQDIIFEAVIGSGKAYSILDWSVYCFKKMGLDWEKFVIQKQGFVPEYSILVSNPARISSIGWTPQTDFWALADLMMDIK